MTTITVNPFQLFDLPKQYFIDLPRVNEKYLALQKQFHPDNFANKTAKERLMATQISANVVKAHKILQDPVARASCLLNLSGFNFDLADYVSHDKMLLLEQMTLREQLEFADLDELPQLQLNYQQTFSELEWRFSEQLTTNPTAAAELVLRMRYYQKLLADLSDKLANV